MFHFQNAMSKISLNFFCFEIFIFESEKQTYTYMQNSKQILYVKKLISNKKQQT